MNHRINLIYILYLTKTQQFNRYVSIPALKHYFNVSNSYVLNKLILVLFPWRHKPWSRQQARMASTTPGPNGQIIQQQYSSMFLPPRDDLNSPDMYIPVMALVTYILLSVLLAGFRGDFHPELLGSITTTAIAVIAFEILCLKLATYILNINNDSQLLDLVAYSGYKFVGIIVTMVASEVLNPGKGTRGWVGWTVFVYTFLANAFFLVSFVVYLALRYISQLLIEGLLASVPEICAAARLNRLCHARRLDAGCGSISA